MTDEIKLDELPAVSPEVRTWGRKVLDSWHALEALHTPVPHWSLPGADEDTYTDHEEALALLRAHDPDANPEALNQYVLCAECSRVEREFAEANDMEEWTHLESIWPCRTAKAMTLE